MEPLRIGVPRGLLYYEYGDLWQHFFVGLGARVIVSEETTKAMLTAGGVLGEVCLPLKVYAGHAATLAGKADCLFVPRVVSVARQMYTCPKMMGLPDLIRSNIATLPEVIDIDVSLRQRQGSLADAIWRLGRRLGQGKIASLGAWYGARRQSAVKQPVISNGKLAAGLRIGLIGHSYLIQDKFISMNAKNKLTAMGLEVITPDQVPVQRAQLAALHLQKKIYWSYCHHLAGTALALIDDKAVDGLIFMTSFSCGPDSMINEIIRRKAESGSIPFMLLNVEEHTAEAGFLTRLEAFTDMIKRRNRR